MKALGLFVSLAWLVACAAPSSSRLQRVAPTPYQGAGTEQFFLPELPSWANGNLSAACARTLSVRYLDHTPLERLHGLNFVQRVELQTQFNRKWAERYAASLVKVLTPQEEAVLFLESLEQVKGGLRVLKYPAKGRLHVVWWDLLHGQAFAKGWLQKLGDAGEPVILMSFCTDARGLEAWSEVNGFADYGFFAIGAETMGPTGPDNQRRAGPIMPLDALLPRERLVLWIPGNYPAELPQGLNVKTVEDPHVRKKR